MWRETPLREAADRDTEATACVQRLGGGGRLLRRLLGPEGPELSCEECFELLDVYVEAEMAGKDADARVPGMRAHLEGCPACAEEHRSLREFVSGQE